MSATIEKLKSQSPLKSLQLWLAQAKRRSGMKNFNAATLSTVSPNGQPHGRLILVKKINSQGLTFYTNSQSSKGQQMNTQSKVALTLYWESLGRQVRVEGRAKKLSLAATQVYWKTRDRNSQVAQLLSLQSQPLRGDLKKLYQLELKKWENKVIPCPQHWRGYCVFPQRVEFWIQGNFRLHSRIAFDKNTRGAWTQTPLYP